MYVGMFTNRVSSKKTRGLNRFKSNSTKLDIKYDKLLLYSQMLLSVLIMDYDNLHDRFRKKRFSNIIIVDGVVLFAAFVFKNSIYAILESFGRDLTYYDQAVT